MAKPEAREMDFEPAVQAHAGFVTLDSPRFHCAHAIILAIHKPAANAIRDMQTDAAM